MASFLVLYGTSEGQTARVASRIVDALERRGHDATAVAAAFAIAFLRKFDHEIDPVEGTTG